MQGNKPWRRVGRDRCVLWVCTGRVGRVGTAGVDHVEALDLVAQIAYVRDGSAGRERGDVGSAREGHSGREDEEVAKDLRGGAEVAAARRDNRGGSWHGAAELVSDASGACMGARRACQARRDRGVGWPLASGGVRVELVHRGLAAPRRVRACRRGRG